MTGAPTQPCGEERRRRRAFAAAVTIPGLFAAILYFPSLWGGWVMDDKAQVRDDTLIHAVSNLADVLTLRILGRDVIDGHRPVQLASLMIDSALWGRNPLGYRLTNLLLHACCTALVAYVSLRLLRESPRWRGSVGEQGPTALGVGQAITAALAAMLFAAHPLAVEAAAVPTNKEDLLVTFFTLMGMACIIGLDRHAWLRGTACVLCCLLAVGSKESGVAAAGCWGRTWPDRSRGPVSSSMLFTRAAVIPILSRPASDFVPQSHPSAGFGGIDQCVLVPLHPDTEDIRLRSRMSYSWALHRKLSVISYQPITAPQGHQPRMKMYTP